MIVTTTNDVTGYRVTQHLGVVRGLTVRSRSIIGNIGAGIQSLFGGNITIYTELAERAREEAYNLMVEHAASAGPTGSLVGQHRHMRRCYTRSPTRGERSGRMACRRPDASSSRRMPGSHSRRRGSRRSSRHSNPRPPSQAPGLVPGLDRASP